MVALFLFFTFIAGLALIYLMWKRKRIASGAAVIAGVLFALVYWRVDKVPESLTQAAPYLMTLIVLVVASQSLRPPTHAGLPYRSGEDH